MHEDAPGSPTKLVLIVDDEPLIAVMMSQAFEEEGYSSLVANSADQALEMLSATAQRIQLVVTDVQMPGSMNGLELGHVIAERFPDLPVITMTGFSTEGQAEAVGPVLRKPFALDHLLSTATRIMDSGRFWRQMMRPRAPGR